MRARYPDTEGFVDRGGVKVGYEVFGEGEPAVVFAPLHLIVHSRVWKTQVPYLARRFKVITIDHRGNGRSDRPTSAAAYAETEFGYSRASRIVDAPSPQPMSATSAPARSLSWTPSSAGSHDGTRLAM